MVGVPPSVARVLAAHRIVVAALWAPGSSPDAEALAEARAGAAVAGVGFAAVNVLDEREVRPLVTRIGVVEDPSVLVYRRGSSAPVFRLQGFVDREAVAQAAYDAATVAARSGTAR